MCSNSARYVPVPDRRPVRYRRLELHGPSSVIELNQDPSSSNNLSLYPYDDRQGSGATYQASQGQAVCPASGPGPPSGCGMHIDANGTYGRAWADAARSRVPGKPSTPAMPRAPVNPFQWLGVTLLDTEALIRPRWTSISTHCRLTLGSADRVCRKYKSAAPVRARTATIPRAWRPNRSTRPPATTSTRPPTWPCRVVACR